MRRITAFAALLLSLTLAACNSIETRPADTAEFEALGYTYFKWRSEPLANSSRSTDTLYVMDPIIRRQVNAQLQAKGYILDEEKAQFSVDYLQAMGLRMGVDSQDASGGIDPIPSARPNRQINQAMVDNANALSGVQETNNVALQFNSMENQQEIWSVVITKIVDNTNRTDPAAMEKNLARGIQQGLSPLPSVN